MSLRSKIVIILSAVVLAYALTDTLILRTTVSRGFLVLERTEAREDINRILESIEKEILNLDKLCFDWSVRDQTYQFAADRNAGYVESNLGLNTFRSNRIELFYICDMKGKVIWGDIRDPDSGEQIKLAEFPRDALFTSHPLLLLSTEALNNPLADFKRGIFPTELGLMLVSSRPILPSDGGDQARGRVIVGKFLDQELLDSVHDQARVSFRVWPLNGGALPDDVAAVLDDATASTEPVLRQDDESLFLYTTLPDVNNYPALVLRAVTDRDVAHAGATAVRYALLSTIASGLIMLTVLLWLLQRTVIAPLSALTAHAVSIGHKENFAAKIGLQRDDEFGILSCEFDNMMDKLAQSRAALAETARTAGMSEIATGILHNVGNVLNSVNVSAALVSEKTQDLGVSDLESLSELLAQNAEDLAGFVSSDPRGKQLQPYLQALAEHVRREQSVIAAEVQLLTGGIEHIRELISSQQGFAKRSGFAEEIVVAEQVEEAITITNRALAHDPDLEIIREFDELHAKIDKHKLLEIMVNLIQNARQAMAEAEIAQRRLTLRTLRGADGRFRIEVADNGVGIPQQALVKVFNLGFTTKANGHGFGLHAAANAANEMGGSLSVRSDGRGTGATFVLDLPLQPAGAKGVAA